MSLTNEDLLAISQLLDTKLDARLKPIENDIKSIRDEQILMKDEQRRLWEGQKGLCDEQRKLWEGQKELRDEQKKIRDEQKELRDEQKELRDEQRKQREELKELREGQKELRDEQKRINLIIENDILHGINILVENYVPAAKRFEKAVERMDAMQADIDIMKKVLAEHSEKLEKIS
ncbi:hypothetical protein C817_01662 [Dorea sp. 5-2]|jgi:uncharacterized phage infection (PIP) family protein YhgE|nr:hypothetical protein C817_01662 [Dorea sp. 5-2]